MNSTHTLRRAIFVSVNAEPLHPWKKVFKKVSETRAVRPPTYDSDPAGPRPTQRSAS
jgi:hypothetical protein